MDYHADLKSYWEAKFNIFKHPSQPSHCVYAAGFEELEVTREGMSEVEFHSFENSAEFSPKASADLQQAVARNRSLSQPHLRGSINALLEIAELVSLGEASIIAAFEDFRGLPYRTQEEGEHGGVRFINDSISTVPECSLASIRSFPECDCLIFGGMDRGIDLEKFAKTIADWQGTLVLLPGSGHRLARGLESSDSLRVVVVDSLSDGVKAALEASRQLCIFSPGSPSYDTHKNFSARGEDFARLLRTQAGS